MIFFKHECKINIKSLLIWSMAVACFTFIMLLVYPSMGDELGEMTDMFANMGTFSSMFNMETLNMGSVMGFYGIEVGVVLSLGGAMFAAILGTGLLAKEEANHTTEFIYVTPNDRKYFITQKLLAMTTLIVVFDIICLITSLCSFLIIGEDVEWNKLLLFHLAQLLMHLQLGAICFGVSSFMKKLNVGIGIGISMGLYFLHLLGNITSSVEKVHYITPFYYCDAATVYKDTSIPIANLLIGVGLAIAAIVTAYVKYTRKDLSI